MSDELKATPGPWEYVTGIPYDWGWVVDPSGYCVAKVTDPRVSFSELDSYRENKTDPYAANAHLIAAAPDMYDALEIALSALTHRDLGTTRMDNPDFYRDFYNAARVAAAALAKARGEASNG